MPIGYGERQGQAPRCHAIQQPLPTIVGTSKHALVMAFIAKHFGGVTGVDIRTPFPTILARGTQHQLVTSHIMKLRGTNLGHRADEPLHTISAGGLHHAEVRAFLMKYYGTDQDPRLDEPLHTVTTKDRFGLVTVQGEEYQIADIGMRMLTPQELYRAQGFPEDSIIDHMDNGKPLNRTAQIRMCGNAVCPPVAQAIAAVNYWPSALFVEAA